MRRGLLEDLSDAPAFRLEAFGLGGQRAPNRSEKPRRQVVALQGGRTEACEHRGRLVSRRAQRLEHVFAAIDQMGGKLIRTIGQARANFAMTMMAACYNLKRLVYFRKAGIEAF